MKTNVFALFERSISGKPFTIFGILLFSINVSIGQKVFWTDLSKRKIFSANIDGSEIKPIVSLDNGNFASLAVDEVNKKLYWGFNLGTIQRANLDGTEIEEIIRVNLDDPFGLAIDAEDNLIFVADHPSNKIFRSDLEGGGMQEITPFNVNDVFDIAVDKVNNHIYYTDMFPYGSIKRSDYDGLNAETIIKLSFEQGDPVGLAVDYLNQKVYWSVTGDSGQINRIDFDGQNLENLLLAGNSGSKGIGLNIQEELLFWTTGSNSSIERASFNGRNKQTFYNSGGGFLFSLATYPGDPPRFIPTFSEWGLVILFISLLIVSIISFRTRVRHLSQAK